MARVSGPARQEAFPMKDARASRHTPPRKQVPAAGPAHQAAEHIQAQHDDLRGLVEGLRRIRDMDVLVPQLRALRQSLIRHFAQEEGPEGFRPIVTQSAPHHLDHMHRLFDEHKGFLTTLTLLVERAEAKREEERKEILEEVGMFVDRLRVHESEESQLLSETLYTDLGGSS
jgi:hemerythrin